MAQFVKRLKPRLVLLAEEGDYGLAVSREIRKIRPKPKLLSVHGEKLRPDFLVRLVEKRLLAFP